MSLTPLELKQYYERCENEKLIRIATTDAATLTPEAASMLKAVMQQRGLSEDIVTGLDKQRAGFDKATILRYTDLIRRQPCPYCGSKERPLNATIAGSVVSMIVITNYEKKLHIGCSDCLDARISSANSRSAGLGWWGFPWGIIRTIQSFMFNDRMRKEHNAVEPSATLVGFVLENAGRIDAHQNDASRLRELIAPG